MIAWSDTQTSGRGREGRIWHGSEGLDIAATFRVENLHLRAPNLLAAAAPAAFLESIEKISGVDLRFKWPNDLFLNGRKLAGVLIDVQGGSNPVYLIGVGINVNRCEFPSELQDTATSLALTTGQAYDREDLLYDLAVSLDQALTELEREDCDRMTELFRSRLGLIGCEVHIQGSGVDRYGYLEDLTLEDAILRCGARIPLAIVRSLQPV